jgi:hypothetical protein
VADSQPRREKPVTGFYLKAKYVKTVIAVVVGVGALFALVYSFADVLFWTQDEAKTHVDEYVEHKQEFKLHQKEVQLRHEAQVKQNEKMDAMYDNVLKLGERWKIKKLRRVEKEEDD